MTKKNKNRLTDPSEVEENTLSELKDIIRRTNIQNKILKEIIEDLQQPVVNPKSTDNKDSKRKSKPE